MGESGTTELQCGVLPKELLCYCPSGGAVVCYHGNRGYSVGQMAVPWAPWWWNLKLLNWIMEYSPGSFYTNAPAVVQWSVTIETGLIPVGQEPSSERPLWDKWFLPGPPGGGIWNY